MSIFGKDPYTQSQSKYTLETEGVHLGDTASATLFGYNPKIEEKALSDLGIKTHLIQEDVRESAFGGPTAYKDYLDKKKKYLGSIRAEATAAYSSAYSRYINLGFPKAEAKARAKEYAKKSYEMLMDSYNTIYPNSGEKVREVF